MQFDKIIKRDGSEFPFNIQKIEEAIEKAFLADESNLEHDSTELAEAVLLFLTQKIQNTPHIEDIQDMVELVLSNTGYASVAKTYILYRENRRLQRQFLEVQDDRPQDYEETEVSLIVENIKSHSSSPWDANIIYNRLIETEKISNDIAKRISSTAERKILSLNLSKISTQFINEITSNLLFEMGYQWFDFNSSSPNFPLSDIDKLFFNRSAHTSNNPDKIRTSISNHVLKQYSLNSVFSSEISDAHENGQLHISGVGHPGLFSSGLFSIQKIIKNGLDLKVLPSFSKPAQHIGVLTSQINTFLSCMRSFFYGPLALSYLNIYYSPFLDGLSDKEIIQEAQNLIYITSQNAFSQGGKSLPIEFNIYSYTPNHLKNKKALGPGGIELEKTYEDCEINSLNLMDALLDCLDKGDGIGNEFVYPIINIHYNDQCFRNSEQNKLLEAAARIATKRKQIRFIKDSQDTSQHSSQIQLLFKHPADKRIQNVLKSGPFILQTVSVNLPQILLQKKSSQKFSIKADLSEELNQVLRLAYKAHKEKLKFLKSLAVCENSVLEDIFCLQSDGLPIVDLEQSKTLIAFAGLNEFIYLATGDYFDVSGGSFISAQEVLRLFKESMIRSGFTEFEIDLDPDPEASQRFARLDCDKYIEAKKLITITDSIGSSYTNSCFIRNEAQLSLSDKYEKESLLGQFLSVPSKVLKLPGSGLTPDEILQLMKNQF
ncbi:MAG: hypothetical protein COA79_08275 [Planctomycetota bacterium]|nr:MAG: hypothetical protein COA79_08275 [Planctomycetota bacterium]